MKADSGSCDDAGEGIEEPDEEKGPSAEPLGDVQADLVQAEKQALGKVLADTRRKSAQGRLARPSEWEEAGFLPEHMTATDLEMFVYVYLVEERKKAEDGKADDADDTPAPRSATRAVGVPHLFDRRDAEQEETAPDTPEEPPSPDGLPEEEGEGEGDPGIPDGFELVELEGELVLVPLEDAEEAPLPLDCSDIEILMGKRSYYLYSRDAMTDKYARWAFLACEDDRLLTFVECVRDESRVYPRPMPASSLQNEPFSLAGHEVEELWHAAHESGEYPDIEQTVASNGEVFYYSTESLSPSYASSLAEWDAVGRAENP